MNEPINVLLVEDNPGDVLLVQEALHESKTMTFNLFVSDNLAHSLKCIAAENIHVILLDLNLPDSRGIETFRQVYRFAMGVPIIIVSILSDNEMIYQAMREGAQAYLIKGLIENESLVRNIRYSIWSYHSA